MNDKPVSGSDGQAQSARAAMQSSESLTMITSGARRVREALTRVIVGQNEAIDLALVTLLAGGPPCQGFSLAGRRRHDDQRNRAIRHYFEMVKLVRPTLLLIENVRGITVEFGKKRRK